MSKKDMRRQEMKSERQAVRQAIRGDHHREPVAQTWAHDDNGKNIPVIDDVMPHRSKKKGCKRNKGGKHTVVSWPRAPFYEMVLTEHGWERVLLPYWRRPYHPPYRCKKCHKGFYRIPRGHTLAQGTIISTTQNSVGNPTPEELADHGSIYNIKIRLLGLKCRCGDCNAE